MFVLVGARLAKNKAGYSIKGSLLFGPPSMSNMDSSGSASASLAATTHAVVPPVECSVNCQNSGIPSYRSGMQMKRNPTSGDDNIDLLNGLRELVVKTHCDSGGAFRSVLWLQPST